MLPGAEPERTEGHRDDDVISSNPLSVLNLHTNRLHGPLGVTPVHTAHWSSVGHQPPGELRHQASNQAFVATAEEREHSSLQT